APPEQPGHFTLLPVAQRPSGSFLSILLVSAGSLINVRPLSALHRSTTEPVFSPSSPRLLPDAALGPRASPRLPAPPLSSPLLASHTSHCLRQSFHMAAQPPVP